jgi:hypothetical protein
MRIIVPATLVLLVVPLLVLGGLTGLARGEDPAPAAPPIDNEALLKQIHVLQREVAYLRSREARTSEYLLKHADRSDALKRMTAEMRTLGFTAAAIPAPARERLLTGLDAAADSLKKDLPVVTAEEARLLESTR